MSLAVDDIENEYCDLARKFNGCLAKLMIIATKRLPGNFQLKSLDNKITIAKAANEKSIINICKANFYRFRDQIKSENQDFFFNIDSDLYQKHKDKEYILPIMTIIVSNKGKITQQDYKDCWKEIKEMLDYSMLYLGLEKFGPKFYKQMKTSKVKPQLNVRA